MGKFMDAMKPFEQFRAPWETEDGSEAEIDKAKLKRFVFNALTDKAKAQDAREEALESIKTLEADLETAKAQAAEANGPEVAKRIEKLETDLAASKQKVKDLESAKEISDLRSEVLAGLDPKVAKYVTGTTKEELEASLKEVRADFNLPDPDATDDDDDDNEDDEPVVRTRPRVKNPADPDLGSLEGQSYDPNKVADTLLGNIL